MCTLVFAWQQFVEAPIAVAANRDEQYDRESAPPAVIESEPTVVAPRDATAGGTWIGYNDSGLFAGITNRWVDGLDAERSRGLLVRDALRTPDVAGAVDTVEEAVAADSYDGFNLLLADADDAVLLEWDGELHVRKLDPGVHVLVNVGLHDEPTLPTADSRRGLGQAINARSVQAALDPRSGEAVEGWLDRALDVLADHDYGVCLHDETFGTVSTSLIRLGDGEHGYEFAPGAPCETPLQRVDVSYP